MSVIPNVVFIYFRFSPLGDDGGELNAWQKVLTFYRAPVTKFTGNSISYMCFLILYSYFILFNF